MTFVAYLGVTAAALVPAFLSFRGLDEATARLPGGTATVAEPGGAVLLDATARAVRTMGPATAISLAIVGALSILLSPALTIAWMRMMAGELRVAGALRRGVRSLPRALACSAIIAAVGTLVLGLSALLPLALHFGLETLPDPRWHDVAVVLGATPAAAVVMGALLYRDVCLATLAASDRAGVLETLRMGAASLDPSILIPFVAGMGAATALGLLAPWAAAALDGPTALEGALSVAVSQTLLLARTGSRGLWLAACVDQTVPAARTPSAA
jgi:hypothetical protein